MDWGVKENRIAVIAFVMKPTAGRVFQKGSSEKTGIFFFFLISTKSYQGIKHVELVDELINESVNTVKNVFFFLISTQSYQGIKLVELVDGVCWVRVELINGSVNTVKNVFFLISTQSY
ncbi:hypothetical protein LAZ67_2004933 [Cordylochernes scorpioides]|uniref:Uncharacterized protein n=1 Tax=Cordylochernes scorpioides TaxID=51811 RepID=A0ABY6K8K9_9ARAC|nr:hypothetical protein LAZ67_2004933 [Cordylochernes scorpioides]